MWVNIISLTEFNYIMYYILLYETIPDYVEKRQPFRAEHLRLAQAAVDSGALILGGAFANPADGAALIFKGNLPKVARDFAENDPYVQNGLIKKWTVREWTVVVGQEMVG